MCINVANEQLQQHFNQQILQLELDECSSGGVALDNSLYACNGPILDLFLQKNVGLLALMDIESRLPQGTDQSLAFKLHQTLGDKEGAVYHVPPNKGTSFGISHYAGYVSISIILSL